MSAILNLNDRHFVLASNSGAGDAKAGTTFFHFRQEKDRVWATYQGGAIALGMILGKLDESGHIELRFQQLTVSGVFKSGRGVSTLDVLPDGRQRLRESWEFTTGDSGQGQVVLEEVEAPKT